MMLDLQIKIKFDSFRAVNDKPSPENREIIRKALADFMKATQGILWSCELTGEFAQWMLKDSLKE